MFKPKINFTWGAVAGFVFCLLLTTLTPVWRSNRKLLYNVDITPAPHHRSVHDLHDTRDLESQKVKEVEVDDLPAHPENASTAKELLAARVRVLVWVMTSPKNLDKKAIHVQKTWGRRADILLFMSSKQNRSFPAVGLGVPEGREHLTAKTMRAFGYVYDHYFYDADWFMKADDDTYVIMENLRYLLSSYNSRDPIYFGQVFKVLMKQGFPSGGAGYVLSREALRRLATRGLGNPEVCRQDGPAEDVGIGRCLMNLGVKLLPSLDRLGRSRFHCFLPEMHIKGEYQPWYRVYDAYGAKSGFGNISDYPVSFHYIPPSKMYAMEYFVYHLRPYGRFFRPPPVRLPNNPTGK